MIAQSNQLTLSMLAYAAQRGISPTDLCRFADIDLDALLKNKDKEILPRKVNSLWMHAVHLTKDPLFGLHFGESLQLAALGAVGEIVKSSSTVGEAIRVAASLTPLVTHLFTMDIVATPKHFEIHLIPQQISKDLDFLANQMADLLMAFTVHEMDGLMLKKVEPLEIFLPKALTASSEYERVFRCSKIKKGKPFRIKMASDLLDTPILTANHHIQKLFLDQVKSPPGALPDGILPLNKRVCNFLTSNACLKIHTLEEVAANFNISPRTFQRKLKEEGITFQQIADSVRKFLAVEYVQSGHYSIKEISYLLGYNEHSAFSKAFKRWTGKSPVSFK